MYLQLNILYIQTRTVHIYNDMLYHHIQKKVILGMRLNSVVYLFYLFIRKFTSRCTINTTAPQRHTNGSLSRIQFQVSAENSYKKGVVIWVSAVRRSRLLVHTQERHVDPKSLFLSEVESIPDTYTSECKIWQPGIDEKFNCQTIDTSKIQNKMKSLQKVQNMKDWKVHKRKKSKRKKWKKTNKYKMEKDPGEYLIY